MECALGQHGGQGTRGVKQLPRIRCTEARSVNQGRIAKGCEQESMLRQASASPQCRPARLSKTPALQRPSGRHRPRAGHRMGAPQASSQKAQPQQHRSRCSDLRDIRANALQLGAGLLGLGRRPSPSSSGADQPQSSTPSCERVALQGASGVGEQPGVEVHPGQIKKQLVVGGAQPAQTAASTPPSAR